MLIFFQIFHFLQCRIFPRQENPAQKTLILPSLPAWAPNSFISDKTSVCFRSHCIACIPPQTPTWWILMYLNSQTENYRQERFFCSISLFWTTWLVRHARVLWHSDLFPLSFGESYSPSGKWPSSVSSFPDYELVSKHHRRFTVESEWR